MALGSAAICMTPDNTGGLGSKAYALTTTSGNAVFLASGCELATGNPAQATLGDTAGWTWTLQYDQTYATGANPRIRVQLWSATSNGSANTVTITHGDGGVNPIGWLAFQISGANPTPANLCVGTEANGDPTITFANSPASGALFVNFLCAAQNNALTSTGSAMAALGSQQPYASSSGRIMFAQDTTPAAGGYAYTSSNLFTIGIGFEVQEAAAGGSGKPTHFMNYQRLRRAA